MTKQDKRRQKRESELVKKKREEAAKLPVNRYLNARGEDGKLSYSMAGKVMTYYVDSPDAVLNSMRLANALLHELRWRKTNGTRYKLASEGHVERMPLDKNGSPMEKDDCYLAYISESQNVHLVLSKLREHLACDLLPKADGKYFSFRQYDEFVSKVDKIVSELGFTLFPSKIELIEPR